MTPAARLAAILQILTTIEETPRPADALISGYFRAPVLQGVEVHLEDFHPIKYMWWADKQEPPETRPMPALERLAPTR